MIGYLAILDTAFTSIRVKHASGAFSGCRHIARTTEKPEGKKREEKKTFIVFLRLHKFFYKTKITLTTALQDTQGRSLMKNRFPPGMIFESDYSRLNNLNSQASCQLLHHQDIKKIITNCISYQYIHISA